MAIPLYLAMTAAELQNVHHLPDRVGWMACHFSPNTNTLCDLPPQLPGNSLLILDDRIPVRGHDPERIFDILLEILSSRQWAGLLLDLQRPGSPETWAIVKKLLSLPCPVIVSEWYAKDLDCPVFLPPVPLELTLEDYIKSWKGRDIWLDLAPDKGQIIVDKDGCRTVAPDALLSRPLPYRSLPLSCHYRMDLQEGAAVFTLQRTVEDLYALQKHAADIGISAAVGLYREFMLG